MKFYRKERLSSTATLQFRPTFCNFILGPYCIEKFAHVLSYVVFTQVMWHVRKQMTKRRYGEEKQGCFVFGKPVFFTLVLGHTTPYSLGISVSNFYQTFVTVSIEFWLIFESQIRLTEFAKKNLIHHC